MQSSPEPSSAQAPAPASEHRPQPADTTPDALSALRRFTRARPSAERCELCGVAVAEVHPHLLNRASRQIVCSCDACAILFSEQQGGKLIRVPRRVRQLADFGFSDLQWEAMMLPINLAFFLRNQDGSTSVFYPSPAGAIESLLTLPVWQEHFADTPELASIEAEVEALLVNRVNGQALHLVVPIDECYRLVGLIRTKWRGLSGGAEVWQAVDGFFADIQRRVNPVPVRYA